MARFFPYFPRVMIKTCLSACGVVYSPVLSYPFHLAVEVL